MFEIGVKIYANERQGKGKCLENTEYGIMISN